MVKPRAASLARFSRGGSSGRVRGGFLHQQIPLSPALCPLLRRRERFHEPPRLTICSHESGRARLLPSPYFFGDHASAGASPYRFMGREKSGAVFECAPAFCSRTATPHLQQGQWRYACLVLRQLTQGRVRRVQHPSESHAPCCGCSQPMTLRSRGWGQARQGGAWFPQPCGCWLRP